MPNKRRESGNSKKRLDLLLVDLGLAESRNKAQAMILAGQIESSTLQVYNSRTIKPGTLVPQNSPIKIKSLPKFVSRGGEKLQAALDRWKETSPAGKVCLDIGSSTGGFTDCLLQNGAVKVYAVDVGYGQMHPKLRGDPRVELYEKSHILRWQPPWPDSLYKERNSVELPTLITIDVSFISLTKVLPRIVNWMKNSDILLALVKPQFEVGPKFLKKGIVKDEKARAEAIEKIAAFAVSLGLKVKDRFPCPIRGAEGNQEEWMRASPKV